jgi:hypothetical protein
MQQSIGMIHLQIFCVSIFQTKVAPHDIHLGGRGLVYCSSDLRMILFQMISGFKYRNEYINVIKSVNLMTQVTNNVHDSHIVKPQIKSNISDTSSGDLKQTK